VGGVCGRLWLLRVTNLRDLTIEVSQS
jgi:hypothetical protein